jgi:hypothetical protein
MAPDCSAAAAAAARRETALARLPPHSMSPPTAPPIPIAAEVAGWYGTIAILAAYALSTFAVLHTADRCYQLLNITGALGVAWVCWHKRTWQAFWLEAVWGCIGLVALARSFVA